MDKHAEFWGQGSDRKDKCVGGLEMEPYEGYYPLAHDYTALDSGRWSIRRFTFCPICGKRLRED